MDILENPGTPMSVYRLKSRFQALLRPLVKWLAASGVSANQVTVAAMVGSILVGGLLILVDEPGWFALVPIWFLLRMGLNAIDGMLAREHDQKTRLGAFLNEIGDVVSDAALYAPFALVAPFSVGAIATVIGLSMLTEFAGVLGAAFGTGRRYDGPMGKSDRAVVFGVLGAWVAVMGGLPAWVDWGVWALGGALVATTINRIRAGLRDDGD